jgi:hypothetical protein
LLNSKNALEIQKFTHFGRHLCKKGTHEENWASRFTQFGISWPQRIWVNADEKWLQFLFIKWYWSPRNWLPTSSIILRTSSSAKSVLPIWMLCLKSFDVYCNYFAYFWDDSPKSKLFSQLLMFSWGNLKNATEKFKIIFRIFLI